MKFWIILADSSCCWDWLGGVILRVFGWWPVGLGCAGCPDDDELGNFVEVEGRR